MRTSSAFIRLFLLGLLSAQLAGCSSLTSFWRKSETKPPAAAKREPLPSDIEEALAKVSGYKLGDSREPLAAAAAMVRDSQDAPPRRAALARGLGELLASDTTPLARDFAARQLALIGSDAEVPVIAPLLGSDATSDWARYALERNPSPAAGLALERALPSAKGKTKVGIVNSLGERREAASVPVLASLIHDSDPEVTEAAIAALGKIGDESALRALIETRKGASPATQALLGQTLLLCAEAELKAGARDRAAAIYTRLNRPEETPAIRRAAVRGWLESGVEGGLNRAVELVQGDDPRMRAEALRYFEWAPGAEFTVALAGKLPVLAAPAQVAVVDALGARGDATALPAVAALAASSDHEVRVATLRALGPLGDVSTVELLAHAAASADSAEASAAQSSLGKLKGTAVDAAMIDLLSNADPAVRLSLIRAIGARRSPGAIGPLIAAARKPDEPARAEAIKVLTPIVGESDLPALGDLLKDVQLGSARPDAELAMIAAARGVGDEDKRTDAVLAAFGSGDLPEDVSLSALRVLGELRGAKSLKILSAALKSKSPAKRQVAIAALSGWNSAEPAAELLDFIRNSSRKGPDRALAVRACAGLVAGDASRTPEEKLKSFASLKRLATAPDESKGLIEGLGEFRDSRAFPLLEPFFKDPAAGPGAMRSAIRVASAIQGVSPKEAKAALQAILAASPAESERAEAEKLLASIAQFGDFITAWEMSGPYRQKGKSGSDLFDISFPPEVEGGKDAKWVPAPAGLDSARPWMIDLRKAMGGDNRVAYLRTHMWSPKAQAASLELGSDDGVKAWLNGEVVHAKNASRPVVAGEDKAPVKLRQGWNLLLVKVTNGGADWGACARLRTEVGEPLEGVRAEVSPGR